MICELILIIIFVFIIYKLLNKEGFSIGGKDTKWGCNSPIDGKCRPSIKGTFNTQEECEQSKWCDKNKECTGKVIDMCSNVDNINDCNQYYMNNPFYQCAKDYDGNCTGIAGPCKNPSPPQSCLHNSLDTKCYSKSLNVDKKTCESSYWIPTDDDIKPHVIPGKKYKCIHSSTSNLPNLCTYSNKLCSNTPPKPKPKPKPKPLKCPIGSKPDKETGTYCVEKIKYTGGHDRYNRKLVSANDLHKETTKKKTYDIKTSRIMNIRDLYTNLCPVIYNEKQVEIKDMAHKVNQLPGYTDVLSFDSMRQVPFPKIPFPVDADYF